MDSPPPSPSAAAPVPLSKLAVRGATGGALMGLANLVPGISGGTMLLAAGVYPQFVRAIADITTFKLSRHAIVVLGSVVTAALLAIVALAGPVKDFVVEYRWVAYSIFIGLTLGGLPVIRRLLPALTRAVWTGATFGFVLMGLVAWVQAHGTGSDAAARAGFGFMLVAGMAGASAMILPGVSGGYLLLVMGVYVPILSGVESFKEALTARDLAALSDPVLHVVLPVGIGVVVGVVAISNVLKFVLARYEEITLGVLLGLLLGAVVGLWPFQEGQPPQPGETFKGQVMTAETIAELRPVDYPTRFFTPSAVQIASALGLVLAGFAATMGVARLGQDE
jgi:putative membrane protein